MDEGVGDEGAAVDAVGGRYLRGKDGEYSRKADGASMLASHEMIIPSEGQYHRGLSPAFASVLEDKNTVIRGVSQHPCVTSHCTNDTGVMVEELTLRNYNGENLAIVGTSKNRDIMQTRHNPWQHLYQIAGGLGSGSSREDALYKDCGQATPNAWEDVGYTDFSELLGRKSSDDSLDDNTELLPNNENKVAESNMPTPPAGIRTKILSKSGFSEYFVKNTLKGKGVIFKGPAREGFGTEFRGQPHPKAAGTPMVAFDAPLSLSSKTVMTPSRGGGSGVGVCLNAFNDGVNLRDWLKAGHCKAKKMESLCIFRQIVDFVDVSHSQGVALKDIRPSCFKLLRSNQVIYLGPPVLRETAENLTNQDNLLSRNDRHEKRLLEQAMNHATAKKQKFGENLNNIKQLSQFPSKSGFRTATANDTGVSIIGPQDSWNELNKEHKLKRNCKSESNSSSPHVSNTSQLLSTSPNDPLEEKWYTSPEENSGRELTSSSNIYVLGVLLFELLGSFDTERARAAAMSDLHHRILPPSFLSENPKEAGFCLWLLHPEPSSRPTAREVLQSDLISGIVESFGDDLSSSIDEDDTESELLSHFLLSLKEEKQKDALKLVEAIKCLESDIEEVEKRQTKNRLVLSCSSKESLHAWGNRFQYNENSSSEVHSKSTATKNELRLMKNMDQMESAYFSTRSNIQLSDDDVATRTNKELLEERDNRCLIQKGEERYKPMDRLGAFFSGLCKYARYSKFEVRGTLRNGDFHNSANVICSLSFDRDQEYFAAAGVSKRIKIFEFQALFNESVDIHYPAIEMSNKSKLSCICWNSYIRNYLASTDYDGIVKRNSLCTIRNIANICCVQFSPHSAHLLAFGSADYKTYCYDLRNVSSPWCILAGHDKAVSYVKFLDSETVISASTDNTLKLWDLNKTSSSGLSTTACISTLKGHTNEKNFVGLSVADGYIACGSETNEVYSYYRSLPMPITSHKFGSIDPISGKETDDDNGQFVSSVCWRKNSDMLIAANSSGCIKVLQMV
ncbi:SPA1-related 2 [Actinidia rufa]|uniref:SPA1-related 2 n=1 Tax=Actinidia rufa TaxID=165716 RepID=A0A7J0G782_9ERIC|nr:SPA1-related 2 [Actinidia rufa]